ncbi:flagellin [Arenibaculum pallidiluteum]|uniref:flagellin n=1 Tax=Arenibaculum pallidiluteum TaxID=2812559 RepID=UPI001A96DB5F|nr:flagellin [Arenibaculum pallidiluteum]
MLFNTISTLGLSKRTQSALTQLQIDVTRTSEELGSGKHFDVAGRLGARTNQAISLRHLHDQTTELLTGASYLDGQMGLMNEAMTGMNKAASDLLAVASTGLSQPSQTMQQIRTQARGALELMVGLLNASSGSGFLFSGVEVGTTPVRQIDGSDGILPRSPLQIVQDAIAAAAGGPLPVTAADSVAVVATLDALFDVRDPALPAPAPLTDTFEGGIYRGATAMQPGGAANPRVSARPEDGREVPYGIQANDPAMRDLLQGMFMLASVDVNAMELDAYKPYVAAAVEKLSAGLKGLTDVQAKLGVQHAEIDGIVLRHNARLKILNERITSLEDADPIETQTRLAQLQAQLEAAMNATSIVSRLRLTDYL